MAKALCQAQAAARKGEVPVGAVVVREGSIVARAHNLRETRRDPAAPCGTHRSAAGGKKTGGMAPYGLYGLRYFGTLPYVRRSHDQCPGSPGGVWGF